MDDKRKMDGMDGHDSADTLVDKEKSYSLKSIETGEEDVIEEDQDSQEHLQELMQEVVQMKDQWLRAEAEMENLRRRVEKEKEDIRKYAIVGFAGRLLPIADNLRRALESSPSQEDLPASAVSLVEGVELIEKELLAAFEAIGIKKIDPLGEKFDSNYHQAMFEVEDESNPPGIVVQVLQQGYSLQERLIRPSLVSVSKKPA